MLDRVDRVQLAVNDAARAAATFAALFAAPIARRAPSAFLNAERVIVSFGESEIELCQPRGPGPVREHLERFGEGLMRGGLSSGDLPGLKARLLAKGARLTEDGDQLYLGPPDTFGLDLVLSPSRPRPRIGPVSFLYEITNSLASDWRQVAARYIDLFGLDEKRFSAISSSRFGYTGTLTLFDPPARLDRIELSQATDPAYAMGRFVRKRGDSLYMCYCEVHDLPAILGRMKAAGARFTARGPDPDTEKDGIWVHPASLHGLLLGVSRTTVAWQWSGRPECSARHRPDRAGPWLSVRSMVGWTGIE